MSYPIQASFTRSDMLPNRPNMLPNRPNTRVWFDRVQARPAFTRALEKRGEPIIKSVPK